MKVKAAEKLTVWEAMLRKSPILIVSDINMELDVPGHVYLKI